MCLKEEAVIGKPRRYILWLLQKECPVQ